MNLTPRQIELLVFTARGMTAKQIGLRLHISRRTVEAHLVTLKNKLGCAKKSNLIESAWKIEMIREKILSFE
jgi:DNA-binding CsgD family transcriptional regulator